MPQISLNRSFSQSLYMFVAMMLVILSVYFVTLPQTVLACPGPTGVTYPGTEAYSSTLTLQMPFISGETWTVGGGGSFYGNNLHCNNPNNDYYATDWNRTNDNGATVLPVAEGIVSAIQSPCPVQNGYGCYVRIDHPNGYRTLYAHLSQVLVVTNTSVHPWTLIGKVGNSGLNGGDPHLHLTFRHFDNGDYYSHCNTATPPSTTCPNTETPQAPQGYRPSPMMTTLGPTVLVDGQSYTSVNGRVYLPDLRNSNSWLSEFYVRNNGTEHRDVSIYYFLPNGLPTPKVSDVCSLYPNQWCWIPVSDLNRVPVGATASAFVDGGEDVSIVVVNRGGAPGYAFTGQYVLSTTMFLPETIDLNAWQMRFPVFNAGSAATDVTTQFFNSSGGLISTQIAAGIAAKGQSSEFPLSDLDPNNNYTGGGRISASQSIAAVAQVFDNTTRRLGYSGTSTADTTVWLPFVMTRLNNGWGTTLWVQNTTGTSSWVEVDFCQEGSPSCYPTTGQVTLSANGMTSFNLRINDYGLGWGWQGSARVSAGQPVAVVVNQLNDGSNLGASYEGVSVAAGFKTVVLPYVVRGDGNCYYSNFTVRNMGTIAAGLTIRYYNGGGSLLTTSTDTVMSHRVYNLYTATPAGQSFPTIPFVGSVVISSTQPIAASSNLLNYCGGSDTISFTGIDR